MKNELVKIYEKMNEKIHAHARENCEGYLENIINIEEREFEKWAEIKDSFKDKILETRVLKMDADEAEDYKDRWYSEDEEFKLNSMTEEELKSYIAYLKEQAEMFFK